MRLNKYHIAAIFLFSVAGFTAGVTAVVIVKKVKASIRRML